MNPNYNSVVEFNIQNEIEQFLYYESELLDGGQFEDWLDIIHEDIEYKVPVRVSQEGLDSDFVDAYHLNETYGTLRDRISRRQGQYAWAERPPSRTRHFISNIRVRSIKSSEYYQVDSNVLLYVSKGDSGEYETLSAKREDILCRCSDSYKISERIAYLDITTLPIGAMNHFL